MKTIQLTKGAVALVDDEDFERVSALMWHLHSAGYAVKGQKKVYMHRFILNAPDDLEVDHINGNKLDNRRSNLRLADRSQNAYNIPHKSGYRGVHYHRQSGTWRARMKFKGREITIGYFHTPEEAALAYNAKAVELRGERAILNEGVLN